MKQLIKKIPLHHPDRMDQLVEYKTSFNSDICELHIFETHETSNDIALQFSNITFTSMMRGKKQMRLGDNKLSFSYLPGASVLVAPNQEMLINFPEANEDPTQCLALTISNDYVQNTIAELNEEEPRINEDSSWNISGEEFYLSNSIGLAATTNNIVRIMMEDFSAKDVLVEGAIKELIIRLMHTQAHQILKRQGLGGRLREITEHIRNNIHSKLNIDHLAKIAHTSKSNFFKLFKQEIGISPNDYILQERIKLAKLLLRKSKTINEVAYNTGFSDANYFTKIFKKMVGMTPTVYKFQMI